MRCVEAMGHLGVQRGLLCSLPLEGGGGTFAIGGGEKAAAELRCVPAEASA